MQTLNEKRMSKLNDEDDYQLNGDSISKTGSTQQLTSTSVNGSSNRLRDDISMEPLRYTQNNIGRVEGSTHKQSPQTPPPPYFTRSKKWSNLRAEQNDSFRDDDLTLDNQSRVSIQQTRQPLPPQVYPHRQNIISGAVYSQQVNSSFRDNFDLNCDIASTRSASTFTSNAKVNVRQQQYLQPESSSASPSSSFKLTATTNVNIRPHGYTRNNILNNNSRY